jgi:periplasmic divalent cation tolerance protein
VRIVYSTFPDKGSAMSVGKKLLEKRLIACFNAFQITSGYWWEGKIVEDNEWGVFFKTRNDLVEKVVDEIKKLHPYSVPAIFTFPIEFVHKDYEKWLTEETGGENDGE